jgi:hypothetical protein
MMAPKEQVRNRTHQPSANVDIELLRNVQKVLIRATVCVKNWGKKEDIEAINKVRIELAKLLPGPELADPTRSTDGLSAEKVFRRGYALGVRTVQSMSDDEIEGTSVYVFQEACARAEKSRTHLMEQSIDGADPEYWDLVKAFHAGLETGLNESLDEVLGDYQFQKLADYLLSEEL